MAKRIEIILSSVQRAELEMIRDNHAKPYYRERAAAVLKVADGQTVRQVALKGLLKRHEPETVSHWLRLYLQQGSPGWRVKSGRGRKAVFSPSAGPASPAGD